MDMGMMMMMMMMMMFEGLHYDMVCSLQPSAAAQ